MAILATRLPFQFTCGYLKGPGKLLSNDIRVSSYLHQQPLIVRHKVTKPKQEPDYVVHEVCKAAIMQEGKGKIYDKKPFKFKCVEGKSYMWCACGWSKTQPFCDGLHNNPHYRIKMRPVRFIAPETKEYLFCNCKQTSKRPFCDGTHTKAEIQSAVK